MFVFVLLFCFVLFAFFVCLFVVIFLIFRERFCSTEIVEFLLVEMEDLTLLEFMYLVFTRIPGERYHKRLRFLLYLCEDFEC